MKDIDVMEIIHVRVAGVITIDVQDQEPLDVHGGMEINVVQNMVVIGVIMNVVFHARKNVDRDVAVVFKMVFG